MQQLFTIYQSFKALGWTLWLESNGHTYTNTHNLSKTYKTNSIFFTVVESLNNIHPRNHFDFLGLWFICLFVFVSFQSTSRNIPCRSIHTNLKLNIAWYNYYSNHPVHDYLSRPPNLKTQDSGTAVARATKQQKSAEPLIASLC